MNVIQSIEDGRKEDGNRSIADKIIKRLHDLDKTVENNQGRWAWELLQNAKDSIAEEDDRTVSIQIELDDDSVEFRHNGTHFTEQDIRGLINQISSKEVEEGQTAKKTGKFGTGFLTTHLLSRVIHVKGIVETQNGDFYRFEFSLDRDGKTTTQLVPKIENAWAQFHESATLFDSDYDRGEYNTSFKYNLHTKEQKDIAQLGIKEFLNLIPFVLAFNPKINRIEVVDNTDFNATTFERKLPQDDDHIVLIGRKDYINEEDLFILSASDDKVAIATKLRKTAEGYSVKSLKDVPKIFCDFPFIGTENFHFPVIVNSFFFNPLTERDGIWLKKDDDPEVEENRGLLERAIELYKQLINKVSSENYFNLYNLVDTRMPVVSDKYMDEDWYRRSVQTLLREFVFEASLVELEAADAVKKPIKEIWFPLKSYSERIREGIWQITFDQFEEAVCKKDQLHKWCTLSWDGWNKLDYREVVSDISKYETIEVLSKAIGRNTANTFNWMNSFYEFIFEDEANLSLGENFEIIPNRNERFKKRLELRIDKIKDDNLVDILELLGEDWKDILIHPKVSFGRYVVKEKKEIANRITEILKNPKSKDENYISAISLLSEWFENNKEEGKDLFSELYRKRAELFMNTIQDKESLYKVMRSNYNTPRISGQWVS